MAANCTCPNCRHKKALAAVRGHFARDDYIRGLHAAVSYLQSELSKDRDHRLYESPHAHATAAGKILLLAGLVHGIKPQHRDLLDTFLAAATAPQQAGEHDDAA
jgi:hypothetical protein